MSSINALSLRIATIIHCRLVGPRRIQARDQLGQATAEYGVVLLVAIALGTAVIMLFTGNKFDNALQGLLSRVLELATGMVKTG